MSYPIRMTRAQAALVAKNWPEFAAELDRRPPGDMVDIIPPTSPKRTRATSGPGTELRKVLASIGFGGAAGCQCEEHAAQMDRLGVDWCEANIPTIIGWLAEEARRSALPFPTLIVARMVRKAIDEAKLKVSNGES